MSDLQAIIEAAFERRAEITPNTVDDATRSAILDAIELLDSGKARVAERVGNTQEWKVNEWLKKAVLLGFRIEDNAINRVN